MYSWEQDGPFRVGGGQPPEAPFSLFTLTRVSARTEDAQGHDDGQQTALVRARLSEQDFAASDLRADSLAAPPFHPHESLCEN